MKRPRRPRDPVELATLVVNMATGEVPNDKEQVLAAFSDKRRPARRGMSAKTRAASQTPERRSKIAKRVVAARWSA